MYLYLFSLFLFVYTKVSSFMEDLNLLILLITILCGIIFMCIVNSYESYSEPKEFRVLKQGDFYYPVGLCKIKNFEHETTKSRYCKNHNNRSGIPLKMNYVEAMNEALYLSIIYKVHFNHELLIET